MLWSGLNLDRPLCHNRAILTEVDFALDGKMRELEVLASEVSRFCQGNGLSSDVEFDLNLVLEELFTNSLRHGGCEGMEEAAHVRLRSSPEGVLVEFADRGVAFDPLGAPEPDTGASLADRPDGGFGIQFVRQVMRDLEYRRADGWNRLTMRRAGAGKGQGE